MSLEIAKLIKERDRQRIIVFGGPQCMRQVGGRSIIKEKYVDAIAVNEGDHTIVELSDIVEDKGCLDYCPGILFKRDGTLVDCGDRTPIEDLDSLPFTDFSDFTPQRYLYPEQLPILSSRGCVWNCQFCTGKIPYCDSCQIPSTSTKTLYLAPEEWEGIWKRIYDVHGEVEIDITGGEPSIYPQFSTQTGQENRFKFFGILPNG